MKRYTIKVVVGGAVLDTVTENGVNFYDLEERLEVNFEIAKRVCRPLGVPFALIIETHSYYGLR